MKSNPLFFDSTKFRGDMVVVEIHIRGVQLKATEQLVGDLTKGEERIRAKFEKSGNAYISPVRLEYQQEYRFSPLILVNEEIFEALDERSIKAQYMINLEYSRMIIEEVIAIPVDAVALPEMNYKLPALLNLTPEAEALLKD